MDSSEEDLLGLLNRKKNMGFRILYRNYFRPMVGFGLRYIDRIEIVEDIVQELFVGIYEKEIRFDSIIQLKTFLYTSVRNACLNELKHEQAKERYLRLSHKEETFEEEDDRKMIEEEVYRLIFTTIEQLPAGCKQVFEYHLQGKKNEEIASLLHISISTVKTQKNRAMRFLRKQLGEVYLLAVILQIL
jgi:RNA polymerase sigma-70 factor (ECF subfamily)